MCYKNYNYFIYKKFSEDYDCDDVDGYMNKLRKDKGGDMDKNLFSKNGILKKKKKKRKRRKV